MGIVFTQGDQITLHLKARNQDLTGASLTTVFKKTDGTDLSIANSAHTIDSDQIANKGKFTLALAEADTQQILAEDGGSMLTKVVQGSDIIHFHGKGILTVKKASFA